MSDLGGYLETSRKLTPQELESQLWKSANMLRGSIDSADYKHYILGLLFLKRLSDVFEEETRRLVEKTGNQALACENPGAHQFFVPPRARWSCLKELTQNIGSELNRAIAELEDHNSRLKGVLRLINYEDKEKLPEKALMRLLAYFSKLPLANENLTDPDILGNAYEYLVDRFADDAGKKGGEFYTPKMVAKLLVEILKPQESMRICDPTVGSGGMLIHAVKYIKTRGGDPKTLRVYGQEKNLNVWAICKMNMVLHGLIDARIEKGDTLRDPKLVTSDQLILFDRVLANPPFSLKNWGQRDAKKDKFGRFKYGIPPKNYGDLAFVQHMLATTNETGMIGIILPHGVLFRGGAEATIRRNLLEEDLIEAVIGLPPNLFYNTTIPGVILVLNRSKDADRKNKVLFIHAAKEFENGRTRNHLREKDVKKIVSVFENYGDVERYSRVVDMEEIMENDYILNISRFVDISEPEEEINLLEVIEKWRTTIKARDDAVEQLERHLAELGLGNRC
ncbi:MAG: N-6 DNA methylase [Candidatus Hodarchaeota archaeon]